MSGKLKSKLKSKKGETITETLVSVLIAAAAMILFASMITSSQRILQKSEHIMDAYYDGETKMEEAMADGGTAGSSKTGAAMAAGATTGKSKTGAPMPADTEGAGEARTGGAADEASAGDDAGEIQKGSGTVEIVQANGGTLSYRIGYRHTNGQIDVTYATNQPNGSSTSGIERFSIAEYKSQN